MRGITKGLKMNGLEVEWRSELLLSLELGCCGSIPRTNKSVQKCCDMLETHVYLLSPKDYLAYLSSTINRNETNQ